MEGKRNLFGDQKTIFNSFNSLLVLYGSMLIQYFFCIYATVGRYEQHKGISDEVSITIMNIWILLDDNVWGGKSFCPIFQIPPENRYLQISHKFIIII